MKYFLSLTFLVCLFLFNCKSQDPVQKSTSKTETQLVGTKWVLSKLNGDPLNLSKSELEQPYIKLTKKDNGVGGNGGCNGFGGTFSLKENQHIAFSQMMATMKYCDENELESVFMANLQKAYSYTLINDELTFNDQNGYVLLTFKVAEDKK
ncbi:META domain-containing protein [Gelidibacter mesophilus]|uniref:META domain-containing protein n=1 Tax=Gelidibacter mesophilus TaxID=169050 RepID=UPI0004847667|nr:META domain-containing protein [Gelidibacter mesophilus]